MTRILCLGCNRETGHHHLHNAAHGIEGTHMAGSERYECSICGTAIYKEHAQKRNLQVAFILD